MPSQTSLSNLRDSTRFDPTDPIEKILAAHGVPPRTKLALQQGARPARVIAAIIEDIRAFKQETMQ